MSNVTISFSKGKKQRNELQLPIQHFVAMDDWVEKLGDKAYIAWMKLYTYADRTDSDRENDVIPNSLNRLCKRVGVSKETWYKKIIPALWDYGFIDFEEFELPGSNQTCLNIIVYEYPQNNPALRTLPIEKIRDYATEWTTKNRENGKKGGRPSEGGSEIEPGVEWFGNRTGGGSEIEPNNVSKSINVSNNKELYVCMNAREELACSSESINDLNIKAAYKALKKHAPIKCYIDDNLPMGPSYIKSIQLMLERDFAEILDPEIVELACEQYFNQACIMHLDGSVSMKFKMDNPVGYFSKRYHEAYKLYKLHRDTTSDEQKGGYSLLSI